ncbi:DMT family transporter [Paracoccaceae bacterium Fryx2]|nr:DMT family transporter [Paracoccaceae bacterium Fryx2]
MTLWIPVTIAAAAVQTLRFMLQKRLKGLGFSTGGATFSRFLFAAPLAACGLAALLLAGHELAPPTAAFWGFVMAGGVAQILATLCTVALFSERSFAVGIAFTKSEIVLVAVFSALVLGEPVSLPGWGAILVGTLGVLLLTRPPQGWGRAGLFNRGVGLGLTAGALFGLSAIGYRGATLEIADPSALFRATVALAAVTTFQTLLLGAWLVWREPGEVGRVAAAWRRTALVGLTGVLGSLGWFVAFALMNAAYVRSLGQVELVFSALVSVLVFRERLRGREIAGMALLALGILGIVAVA